MYLNRINSTTGIRLKAKKYVISKINDPVEIASIGKNKTSKLFKKFKKISEEDDKNKILENVILITPENIHLNSFMYEPILDMSDIHLKNLYEKICSL